ncbi:MAG: hypothetical protein N2Z22_11325, partial [Turneriella sp.]|nr:hypothetical protein [Turneriella sp.]
MAKFTRAIFRWIVYLTSYGIGVATSAAISSILAIFFGLFYARATNFPLTELMMTTIAIGTAILWVAHATIFGIFHKLGFSGITRTVRTVNRAIVATPALAIRNDLPPEEYPQLLHALTRIPFINSLVGVFSVQLLLGAIFIAAYNSTTLEPHHYWQGLMMDVIFSFIHGGYSLVIGEIATGSMRAECKRLMHDKGIPFTDQAVTTVRLKLAFFILLFVITIYVAGSLVYYNRDNLSSLVSFSVVALAAAILMAYMIFYLIYSALKDIATAMDDLKSGGSGLLFTKSIDSE